MTLSAVAQQTPASTSAGPQAITDPSKLESRNVTDMQNFSIEKLYMTRQIGGSTWSPDGKQVAFITNISGRNNLWLLPATGGWPTQLTISDQRQAQPVWSPNGTWIAYISDHDGDEQWDIFLVSPKTGEVTNLTTSPDSAEFESAWSPDGRQMAYATKPKTGSSYEIELIDVATRHVRHLTKNTPKELSNRHPIFSHDGKFLVYTQWHATGKDANVFVVDLASGQSTNLTPHQGQNNYIAADISPDGKAVLITSDARNGYDNVGVVEIASKKIEWLTDEKWELSAGSFSPDGKSLTWTANVDGSTNIYSYDIAGKHAEALPLERGINELGGDPVAFTRDGLRLLCYHNGANAPNDLWVYDIAAKQSQQITHALVAG
ncbi:MAG: hypothetical protein WBW69_24885, partial [Candidatus Korobacteraceae bacterium]